MKPERWRQVDQLFQAALERAPEERAAFISEACHGDDSLRREVEALLAADGEAESFIEAPAYAVAAPLIVEDDTQSLLGKNIGHYQIISLVGKGGMGEVYRARDTKLDRIVALKILPEEMAADRERMQRFVREAKAASALNHPNVAHIYEIGEAEGVNFIAMEYVEGQTLAAKINGQPLEVGEIVEIGSQIADALDEAHSKEITHRDIKPANVMLTPRRQVKVLDFGLAKIAGPSAQAVASDISTIAKTASGVVMGTVPYMSPEQALGREVDQRSDLFSLGVVLYEMATGRLPFSGANSSETLDQILHAQPEAMARFNYNVPAELERVVRKCLKKERERRYQSARELLVDLKNHQRDSQSSAMKVTQVATSSRSRRWLLIAFAVTLLALGGVALYLFLPRAQPKGEAIKSLVVLPLENLSGDPAQEYFADGMTDALIGDLAKIRALRVISRTSAMHYKGTKKSLPEIASELGVDVVVEGTVQRFGDRVVIRAQLIHAATDRHLWTETYARDLRDVLGLQSEVAQTIAREIKIKITPAEQALLAHNRSVNRKAFDDYLQGRYLYWNKRTKENLEKAIEYFQSAIREDPTYALAYVGLADCYNSLGTIMHSALLPVEARRRAEEAARKAIEFDSELAEAHATLGFVNHYNWNWDAAEADFKRAIELNANYANAHAHYSKYLVSRGYEEEAIAEADRARELDPLSLAISVDRGHVLLMARRYAEAIEQLRRVITLDPSHFSAHWFLGHTYTANEQVGEAIASYEKAAALSGRAPGAIGFLGAAYALAGRKDEANKILNELLELDRRRYVTPAALASVYIGLGAKDQAFAWLEKSFHERSNHLAFFKVSPLQDSLRSDPRFDELLRRIGLTP